MRHLLLAATVFLAAAPAPAQEANVAGPAGPRKVMPASDEGESAIRSFKVPPGFKVNLFAAEPDVANISSFDVAPGGKVYVVEVFRRRGGGVLDLRNLPTWVEDDLSSRTVEDRVAMLRRRLPPQELKAMQVESDRVRLVEDRDGDGRADHSTVFADGFNQLESGTAAGVLAFNGNVYFADIPNLWLLRDANNDGRADTRSVLHTGFGVHYEISGHDLHGLRLGPDGRIYFSIGDRALNVTASNIANPDSGAVLRCEPDGSHLELVHTGLRNPQDLAFDEFGDLFTGDNNSDAGDVSRWVYVVEGGDSGWRTGYQWHEFPVSRGPWNNERLWDVKSETPGASIVPPVANPDVAGPAGLTYTGGVGLPPEWSHRFLLVDFRGGANNSGVWALQNKPKGASFELTEIKKLVWGTLATDVECGYDGGVYFSDWVTGWVPMGKGRIYRMLKPEVAKTPAVAEVGKIMAEGFTKRPAAELAKLLGHPDMRVRTAAQLELVRRKELNVLSDVALHDDRQLARLHAIWALRGLEIPSADSAALFRPLLNDHDEEVRAQTANVIGERVNASPFPDLVALFHDPSPRVRFFAAIAAGRLGMDCTAEAIGLLRENNDSDLYVRHAAVMALTGSHNVSEMLKSSKDASAAVRLGILVALRRLGSADVARFLDDEDPRIVLEAARAINDAPIDEAAASLAAVVPGRPNLGRGKIRDLILMRALNARYRLGTAEAATSLVHLAGTDEVSPALRAEALAMIRGWAAPSRLDRVTGVYHPLGSRDPKVAYDAVRRALPELLRSAPDPVRVAAAGLVGVVGLKDTGVLLDLVKSSRFSGDARAAAVAALAGQKAPELAAAVDAAMKDKDRALRRAAMRAAAQLPDGAARLRRVIESGTPADLQAAFPAVAALPVEAGASILLESLDRLIAGTVPPEARLDLVTAAESSSAVPSIARKLQQYRDTLDKNDPLAAWRVALAGGDRERGRKIFAERSDVQCLRCHSIKGEGGNAGPDLAGIGKRQPREYLLESILFPASKIAQGWETVTVRVKGGETFAGVLKSEDPKQIVLLDPEKGELKIDKATVTGRRGGQTAMPVDIAQTLTKQDLRDLVEYLATLK